MEPLCEDCRNYSSRCTCGWRDPGPEPDDRGTRLKLAINNALWMRLPGDTTLDKAEELACELLVAVEGVLAAEAASA